MAGEAVRDVLNFLVNTLSPLPSQFALAGGMALAVWGYPRATRDVDLLIGLESEDFESVLEMLTAHGCRTKHQHPLVQIGSYHIAQFLYTPPDEVYDVQFDLLLAENDLLRSALRRAELREIPGLDRPLRVLACEDLILLKLLAGRLLDLADVAMLLRENHEILDMQYLDQWLATTGLGDSYQEARRSAFPDIA
ncbi:nucleotidyl transferase AbiEii/AbiGii toxin family protein [Aeoliella sp. SH292]|uniref:nucleotidyl transferase AbiEii/AbiGii toxin family protein n=1 Tax=Aeoliella sp. SH292 TaxID=3454464 RepID=UPI003F968A1D